MYLVPRSTTILVLSKRGNMGFGIPPWLIILLVILGGGFAVCCGYALFRFYHDPGDEARAYARRPEQDAYMREVRERHYYQMSRRLGAHYSLPAQHQHLAHAPLSPSASNTTSYG
ncbi:hypothetical protein ACEQ8H_006400 [Pleosporales sp. CAS-2024a]